MQSEDFEYNNDEDNKRKISEHNRTLMKNYLNKSRVTVAFICVIWVMFVIECLMTWKDGNQNYGPKSINPAVLNNLGGNVPDEVRQGQFYRLFTATILHAGILHILMNSLSMLVFCSQVEAVFSSKIYLTVYIIGGIQGNMLFDFYHIMRKDISPIAIGASTSICAVIGLYLANVLILYKKGENIQKAKQTTISILVSLFIISLFPGVDLLGHLGSLMAGLFLGMALLPGSDRELSKMKIVGIVTFTLYTCILLTIFF